MWGWELWGVGPIDVGWDPQMCGAGSCGVVWGATHRCGAQMWGWGDVGQTHRCVGLGAVGLDPQLWGWDLWGRPIDVGWDPQMWGWDQWYGPHGGSDAS